jgi:protein neuralized
MYLPVDHPSKPLKCGEKVVLQVLGIDRTYVGGLAVGFTTCSPDSVTQSELPDDADLLLDRMEYIKENLVIA